MSLSLEEAAADLYAVEPGRFTAERTRLAGAARQAGDSETAKAIGALRRPTTSAWLINQLVRDEQDSGAEAERLEQLGEELREAQGALDATRMRELTKERHQLIASLVRRADEVAEGHNQKISAAVRRELEDTLGAAVADEQASRAVMSGRLTRALTYAGFGEVDVTEATATPLSAVHPYKTRQSDSSAGGSTRRRVTKLAAKRPAGSDGQDEEPSTDATAANGTAEDGGQKNEADGKGASSSQSRTSGDPVARRKPARHAQQQTEEARAQKLANRRAEAEELVERARAEVAAADENLQATEQELEEATSERAELQTRLDELQAEVVSVRRRLDAGDRRVSHAERDMQRQQRQLKDLTKALDRAEAALDRLDPP